MNLCYCGREATTTSGACVLHGTMTPPAPPALTAAEILEELRRAWVRMNWDGDIHRLGTAADVYNRALGLFDHPEACGAALAAPPPDAGHYCIGCGHHWTGATPGTVCGDCWRDAQKAINDVRVLRAELESTAERDARRIADQHAHRDLGQRYAALVALVREWQEARKPATLSAPGEFLAETFQAAVRRMSAADEALAGYRLDEAQAEAPAAAILALRDELRLLAARSMNDPSANAFEHAATMVEALPSSAVSGNCQECGFPLVCVACEAREDARPEWQYGALPTHGQVLAAIASTHPTTEETLVSNFSPPTERPSAWMSLDWRERLRHIVAVVEELRAAGLITVAVDTSTRGRLRLLAPAALETRDRGGQTGCGGTPDAGLVALAEKVADYCGRTINESALRLDGDGNQRAVAAALDAQRLVRMLRAYPLPARPTEPTP